MAENIVSSMFGVTPMQLQQQRQQETNAAAADFARMNAAQRGAMGLYQGGAGIAGMLGMKDPQMEQAQQNMQMQQGIDLTTPEGLKAAALKFQQTGNTQAAISLLEKSRQLESDASTAKYKAALADKALAGSEYERMIAILSDPEASEEEKNFAKSRISALNTMRQNTARQGTQSGRLVSTNKGMVLFDPVTKKVSWPNGNELTPDESSGLQMAQYDPTTASAVAQAGAGGKAVGALSGAAQMALPQAENTLNRIGQTLDLMENHPGFASAVGMGLPKAKEIPGTQEADFANLHDQMVGKAFLMAFDSLRNAGQITEVEGKKATEALNRMSMATSEKAYRAGMADFRVGVQDIVDILKKKANTSYQVPTSATTPQQTASNFNTGTVSGETNPNKIKAMFKAGKLNREQAKRILIDMQSRGLF